MIVDTTVQEKAIAHPVDSRLLDIARAKIVQAARSVGITLKQTFVKEAGNCAARPVATPTPSSFGDSNGCSSGSGPFWASYCVKSSASWLETAVENTQALAQLTTLLERAERLRTQQPKDKNKLYALHAPEVECIGKGKARKPCEFGVKASIAVTHKQGLIVGARSFPGNPYDGHTLKEQLEQTSILLEDVGVVPRHVMVDLGFRGVDRDNPRVQIVHRGKAKSLNRQQRRWLKRRQAVEPTIGREIRPPDGSLLVGRINRRCPAHRPLCGRLQPAMVDAGGSPSGASKDFCSHRIHPLVLNPDQPQPERCLPAQGGGFRQEPILS